MCSKCLTLHFGFCRRLRALTFNRAVLRRLHGAPSRRGTWIRSMTKLAEVPSGTGCVSSAASSKPTGIVAPTKNPPSPIAGAAYNIFMSRIIH